MQPPIFAARDHRNLRLGQPGGRRKNLPLLLGRRILDDDVEHEPIELRFGQRVGAFLLDRVLGREHEQRPVEVEPHTLTVTWYSCIASSRAACVFGGARISSARMMFAKIGPLMNRMTRFRSRDPLRSLRRPGCRMASGPGVN